MTIVEPRKKKCDCTIQQKKEIKEIYDFIHVGNLQSTYERNKEHQTKKKKGNINVERRKYMYMYKYKYKYILSQV